MKNLVQYLSTVGILLFSLAACTSDSSSSESANSEASKPSIFKQSLSLYASFDNFAKGDAQLYVSYARRNPDSTLVGLKTNDHEIAKGVGQQGNALHFKKKSKAAVFYKSKDNIAYSTESWTGTISFWLKVDPATDLEPGFTDPIQITDNRYDDASIWVDFTKENPRDFRLGVYGDKEIWTQDTLNTPKEEVQEKRYVRVKQPPFTNTKWTHVLITYSDLGTAKSTSTLYLDGKSMGAINGITDPFTWEIEKSNIYLGLGFVGMIDELSIFNQAFTAAQVQEFRQLKDGVSAVINN